MAAARRTSKEQKDPRTVHDLVQLISSSTPLGSTSTAPITIYPNDDSLLSLLHARFRHDLPSTRLGSTGLVVVNPNKMLVGDGDAAMKEAAEKTWDVSGRWRRGDGLQSSPFEFAARVYLRGRRSDISQVVFFR
jgi:chitin synthase